MTRYHAFIFFAVLAGLVAALALRACGVG